VLAALAEQTGHGYDLRRVVEEMTDGFIAVDPGGIYRVLRRLEEDGLVESSWAEGDFGPQRREYRLTSEGCQLLVQWRDDLEWRIRAFRSVIKAIERSLALARQEHRETCPEEGEDPNL
jgi:DNA-binding PadR family transcriptional regulator